MRRLRDALHQSAFVAVVATVLGAVWAFQSVRSDVDRVRSLQQENLLWSSSQLESEYLRFLRSLTAFAAGSVDETAESVNLRFDIFWSRIELFRVGDVGAVVQNQPRVAGRIQKLATLVRDREDEVAGLSGEHPGAAGRLVAAFSAVGDDVRQINIDLLQAQSMRESRQYEALANSSSLLTILGVLSGVIGLTLIAIYAAAAQRERNRRRETQSLLYRARQGERARNAFLSMMSHELRTPMNGVLGMIALARQPGLPPGQDAALQEAADSARDMNGLLTDLLELAALDADTPAAKKHHFPVSSLVKSVETDLHRSGLSARISLQPDGPGNVALDVHRVSRLLTQLVRFLDVGLKAQEIDLLLALSSTHMSARLKFETPAPWSIEDFNKEDVLEPGQLSMGAIGREIALGYIDRMCGRLEVLEDGSGFQLYLPMNNSAAGGSSDVPVRESGVLP